MPQGYNSQELDVPVYLVTGFLEAGKTQFIQDTIGSRKFDNGDNTLIIVCEEGEEDLDPTKARRSKLTCRVVEEEKDLTPELLQEWQRTIKPDRVLVEYNGMWMLKSFIEAMPDEWIIQQKFFFADSRTFMNYNANMRSLVFDKIKNSDLVIFNRYDRANDIMPYHKIVRAINRACSIVYEDPDGGMRYDEIEDPLPFDKNAAIINIEDRDYALWYQDMGEDMHSYDGKTVRFKAQVSMPPELGSGAMIVGRHMMNCCAADIQFAGLIAVKNTAPVSNGDWVILTATIKIKRNAVYQGLGPVLTVREVEPAEPPEEKVATFY